MSVLIHIQHDHSPSPLGLVDEYAVDFSSTQSLHSFSTSEEITEPYVAQPHMLVDNPPHIPGYQILDVLGRGGMGIVWQARDGQHRLVAVKTRRGYRLARRCLDAEAKIMASLHHSNIVTHYDSGEYEGEPFLSLEYCEGGNLRRKLNQKAMRSGRAVEMVRTIADVVDHVHQKGIIHQDLKPSNIFLTKEEQPKLGDFGLARELGERMSPANGMVIGTPSYMAPEQATASKELGPPVDIYALGALLYECLTGQPPFTEPTIHQTLAAVLQDSPVSPRKLNPQISRTLETVCLRCLEKHPEDRYSSAGELAKDLE